MTFFWGVHFVETGRAMVKEVADASEFRWAAKIVPFALECRHFGAFGQVLVKVLERFIVKVTTVARSQMADFV